MFSNRKTYKVHRCSFRRSAYGFPRVGLGQVGRVQGQSVLHFRESQCSGGKDNNKPKPVRQLLATFQAGKNEHPKPGEFDCFALVFFFYVQKVHNQI